MFLSTIGIFHYDVDLSTYRMEHDLNTSYETSVSACAFVEYASNQDMLECITWRK